MTLKPSAQGRGRRTAQRTKGAEVIPAGSEWDQLRSHAIVGAATMALFAAGVLVLLAKAIR